MEILGTMGFRAGKEWAVADLRLRTPPAEPPMNTDGLLPRKLKQSGTASRIRREAVPDIKSDSLDANAVAMRF